MEGRLAKFGRVAHKRRATIVAISICSLAISGILIAGGNQFADGNQPPASIEAGRALELVSEELPVTSTNTVTYIFTHEEKSWNDSEFKNWVFEAIESLEAIPLEILSISMAYDDEENPRHLAQHVSADGKRTAIFVQFGGSDHEVESALDEIKNSISSENLEVLVTGSLVINKDFDRLLEQDQLRAEIIGLPISFVILLFVFGTFTAAVLPMAIVALMLPLAIGLSFYISGHFPMTQYSTSMISLIGIAVSIDYSLFMISRFREEIDAGASTEDAIATMMDTAGRAILYSGATVAVGLCSLFYFTQTHMPSMGMGAFLAVLGALLYSLTILPALLSYLGPRINSLRVPIPGANRKSRFWEKFSTRVMKNPVRWLLPAMAVLLLLGSPFLHVELTAGGIETLPPDLESRQAIEILEDEFPAFTASVIPLVIVFEEDQDIFSKALSLEISEMCVSIRETEGVISMEHPFCNPSLFDSEFDQWPQEAVVAWSATVSQEIAMLDVATSYRSGTDEAEALIGDLRVHTETSEQEVLVGGWSSFEVDMKEHLSDRIPIVLAFVLILTMALVWLQVRSIVVPIKAVLMNILSVSASFGLIVVVFQDGLLSEALNFSPQPLDLMVPPLVFGIAFGLSMDYEVLMLSRIHEAWNETGDNTLAVATGLQASGSLITGAAAIMIAVFSGFIFADVMIIKSIGFALAVAVFVDATIVRAIVVPSAMRLMGKANWWSPTFKKKN
ncbi:MAG: MMPL family transporter [Candidatus Thalassarchaeaceae archaeon]|tara:strand:- start:3069 stop:5264 length:2196 start_codon:yes stop_codon:yes gene_type:complete